MISSLKRFFRSKKEESEKPLINILTRTSGRPNGFQKCFESVQNQSYKYINHIVSYDSFEDLKYIKQFTPDILIKVKKKKFTARFAKNGRPEDFKPYNLYCNQLLKKVKSGWVLFLDDDDMLLNENFLMELVKNIKEVGNKSLIIWQTCYPDGSRIPKEETFNDQKIKFMDIDTACFAIHSNYAKQVKWDAWRGADYRYIKRLSEKVKAHLWLRKAFTKKNNFGDQGQRNDIGY